MIKSIKNHAALSKILNADESRVNWHDETLWFIRQKRDIAAQNLPEWEELRELASQIKNHTLSNLDIYLKEFEKKAIENGIRIHWAADANDHNEIIYNLIKKFNIKKVVKSKSMLTEECNLNEFLIFKGIEIIDTDLGERIVQLRNEHPSHIVLPAIHLKKEDVSNTFYEHLGTEKDNNDPQYLTEAARQDLRNKFIQSQLAITGVNFSIGAHGARSLVVYLIICNFD